MGWGMPLTPIMLLLINVVCDGIPGLAFAREKPDPDLMQRAPVKRGTSLFSGLEFVIVMQVTAFVIVGWIGYYIGAFMQLPYAPAPSHLLGQTMAFAVIGWTSIWHIFTARTRRSIFNFPILENPMLFFSAMGTTILVVVLIMVQPLANLFGMVPMTWTHWWMVLALSVFPSITAETHKLVQRLSSRGTTIKT